MAVAAEQLNQMTFEGIDIDRVVYKVSGTLDGGPKLRHGERTEIEALLVVSAVKITRKQDGSERVGQREHTLTVDERSRFIYEGAAHGMPSERFEGGRELSGYRCQVRGLVRIPGTLRPDDEVTVRLVVGCDAVNFPTVNRAGDLWVVRTHVCDIIDHEVLGR